MENLLPRSAETPLEEWQRLGTRVKRIEATGNPTLKQAKMVAEIRALLQKESLP
jgi:hypothetical protein